ncbi:MAG TPA: zf-HC2 domain-containing protein [Bacilli bacterium]
MNCQEVAELMHRHLDRDLADAEYNLLQEHVRHCPSCSLLFARLQRLSGELENLPKVTPRYNLVDAILPRLQEMDRIQAEFGGESSRNARAGIRRSRFPWKTAGGIIAAGFIFAFLFFNRQPLHVADEMLQFGNSAQSAASEQDAAVGMNPASGKIKKEAAASRQTSRKANDSLADVAAPNFDRKVVEMSDHQALAEKPRESEEVKFLAAASPTPADAPKSFAPKEADSVVSVNAAETETGSVLGMTTDERTEEAEPPLAKADSPDSTRTAQVRKTDIGFMVVVTDRQNVEIYKSNEYKADTIENLEWSEDGKQLRFYVTGTETGHVTVDFTTGTETMEKN